MYFTGRPALAFPLDSVCCCIGCVSLPFPGAGLKPCATYSPVSCATSLALAKIRRACSRSSGVSTPIDVNVVSTVLIRMPYSSARSCSSASACSIAVGGSAARRSRHSRRYTYRPMWRQAGAGGQPCRTNGIGAREKYRANPSRSTTTLVTLGLPMSAGSWMRVRSVLIISCGSPANGATAWSIMAGSMSGSSPWTLTIKSHRRSAAISAMRSVPL